MTVTVRPQTDADAAAVQDLINAAFAADAGSIPAEVALNAALWQENSVIAGLTLVAVLDGHIVGQLTSSYGTLTGPDGSARPVAGVGPVSVLPSHQGAGVGSALLRTATADARAAGEPALVLLGAPAFYGRFGFVPAADLGIASPDPAWGVHFQAHPLASPNGSLVGSYRYAEPFDRL